MIELRAVTKRYGPQEVLRDANLRIHPGERVGIVGPNGAGKSTLFRMVTGVEQPDKGDLVLAKNLRWGHLRQTLNAFEIDETLLQYTENSIPSLREMAAEMDSLDPTDPRQLKRLGVVQHEFEHLGGYEMQTRAEEALGGLGFKAEDFARPFADFSGGWQMRAELARVLIGKPDLLLLDEPSNYLDLPAVEWLQRYLRDFQGTLLLVSHDRYLLEQLVQVTVEVAGGVVTRYQGGFGYYLEQREARRHQLVAAKKNQDRRKAELERFIERFKAKNTKASQAQSRQKVLDKMEDIEVPENLLGKTFIRIADPPHCGSETIRLEHVSHAYEPGQWVLRDIDLHIPRGDKVALVGFNGTGKTTLLRILAGAVEPTEGRRHLGHQVVIGYQSQEFAETMPPDRTLYGVMEDAAGRSVTEKEVRTTLGGFGFSGDDVFKTVRVLSGGEKIRLAFARLFLNPPNLLILDEPTTHLDLDGRRALEDALVAYKGTVCLVSHDVTFVRRTAQSIVAIRSPSILRVHGGYDYYLEKTQPGGTATKDRGNASKPTRGRSAAKAKPRNTDAKRRRRLERDVRKAEQEVERLEAEMAALVEQLGEPEADYARLNRQLGHVQAELAEANQHWETAVDSLDQL